MPNSAIDQWIKYVATHDETELWGVIHPDAMFESPIVRAPQQGRDLVFKYLTSAKVIGGPGFRFVNEWRNQTGAVLEFENDIDGIRVNGVDIISTAPAGDLITHFKVMVRPLKAINLLHRLMGEQLRRA